MNWSVIMVMEVNDASFLVAKYCAINRTTICKIRVTHLRETMACNIFPVLLFTFNLLLAITGQAFARRDIPTHSNNKQPENIGLDPSGGFFIPGIGWVNGGGIGGTGSTGSNGGGGDGSSTGPGGESGGGGGDPFTPNPSGDPFTPNPRVEVPNAAPAIPRVEVPNAPPSIIRDPVNGTPPSTCP